jgi:hypothetical protein
VHLLRPGADLAGIQRGQQGAGPILQDLAHLRLMRAPVPGSRDAEDRVLNAPVAFVVQGR